MTIRQYLSVICVCILLLTACTSDFPSAGSNLTDPVQEGTIEVEDLAATSPDVAQGDTSPAEVVDADSSGDLTIPEDEIDANEVAGDRDDVAVRLVDAPPLGEDGSSVLVVEVLGVLGDHGDGLVSGPALDVVAGPGVSFSQIPAECVVTDFGVACDSKGFVSTNASLVETDAMAFEFAYSVSADAALPLVFELTASSTNNPVSNDPDPSNNIQTIEVGAG